MMAKPVLKPFLDGNSHGRRFPMAHLHTCVEGLRVKVGELLYHEIISQFLRGKNNVVGTYMLVGWGMEWGGGHNLKLIIQIRPFCPNCHVYINSVCRCQLF